MLTSQKLEFIFGKINRENPIIPHILPNLSHTNIEIKEELLDLMYSQVQANEKYNINYFAAKHGSFGDLVFSAKVVGVLKKCFPSAEFSIITNAKEDLIKSQIHHEYNIDETQIVTDQEYISTSNPTLLIEAPSFSLLEKLASKKINSETPILLISEYGVDQKLHPTVLSAEQQKREYGESKNISAMNSGLNSTESGILINKNDDIDITSAWDNLSQHLKNALLENQSAAEFNSNQSLSVSYAHQKFPIFAKIYSEFEQYSGKHANLVMLGLAMQNQLNSIDEIKNYLPQKGFTQLILHDAASNKQIFFDLTTGGEIDKLSQDVDERNFKIIFYPKFLHQEAMTLNNIAGPFKGTTGDQSFSDAISSNANSILAYETMIWKRGLVSGYRKIAADYYDEKVVRAITLLTWGATDNETNEGLTDAQIQELGMLIRNQEVQNNIFQLHNRIREDMNLHDRIIMRVNRLLLQESRPWLKQLSDSVLSHPENILETIETFNQALNESAEKLNLAQNIANQLIDTLRQIPDASIDQILTLESKIKFQMEQLNEYDAMLKPFMLKTIQEKMNEWIDAERDGLSELGILKINYQDINIEQAFLRLVQDVVREIRQDLNTSSENIISDVVVSDEIKKDKEEISKNVLPAPEISIDEAQMIQEIKEEKINKETQEIRSDSNELSEQFNKSLIQPFVLSTKSLKKDKTNLENELFNELTKKSIGLINQLKILQMLYFAAKDKKNSMGLLSSSRWKVLMDIYKNVYIEILRQSQFNLNIKKDAVSATNKMIDDQMGFVRTSQTNLRKDVNAVLGNYAKYKITRGIKKN